MLGSTGVNATAEEEPAATPAVGRSVNTIHSVSRTAQKRRLDLPFVIAFTSFLLILQPVAAILRTDKQSSGNTHIQVSVGEAFTGLLILQIRQKTPRADAALFPHHVSIIPSFSCSAQAFSRKKMKSFFWSPEIPHLNWMDRCDPRLSPQASRT